WTSGGSGGRPREPRALRRVARESGENAGRVRAGQAGVGQPRGALAQPGGAPRSACLTGTLSAPEEPTRPWRPELPAPSPEADRSRGLEGPQTRGQGRRPRGDDRSAVPGESRGLLAY